MGDEMWNRKTRLLTFSILTLVFTGLIMIGSSSRVWALYKFKDEYFFVKRQLLFTGTGFISMFISSKIKILSLRKYAKYFYLFTVFLLVIVLIPGIGMERNGSRSWFGLGAFQIQPSEFFKIAIILYVADFLSGRYRIRTFRHDLLYPAFLTMTGFLLILLQPDFGSGIVMVCSVVVMVLAADSPLSYFVKVGVLGIAGLGALILSAPYRLARITSFIDPWSDPLGAGFQMIQSLYAISPGGILGVGFNSSMQKHFYLPEPQTDFIFAIFAEEFGFIGCVILILIFLFIIYEGIKIAKNCHDAFSCYCAVGFISLFAIQVMINLGVVVGLFPITGVMDTK